MIRRPPRSTQGVSSAASDVYKRQIIGCTVLGCSKSKESQNLTVQNPNKIIVVVPKSPVAVPMLRMAENNALGGENKIELKFYKSMEEMTTIATKNDYSFMFLLMNSASTLYNNNYKIKLINVGAWGGMYLSTTDVNFKTWKDLKGKQLYVPNKGSGPDILTQLFLKENGLIMGKDVEIIYSTHPEISQLIKSGKAKYAIDAEPFATFNKENIENYKIIYDYSKEWKSKYNNENGVPLGGIVGNEEFISNNKDIVAKFNEEYQKAIKWTKENPNEAAKLAEKYLNSNSSLMEKAIPNIPMDVKLASEVKKDSKKYYEVFLNYKKESIGGKIPDDNFYYEEKQKKYFRKNKWKH
eukprot:TRINITY_DN12553_c0_g1_i3.p1 TRINITY_DN12553_c0_g1~~TRINITY_DN12553_c0_g1_i3.p1  ORF type:complete len:353 (+),score=75.47 TRINITY_DN12553_c0_g1_i3:115-1173(+)